MRTILRGLAIVYFVYIALSVVVIMPALNFLPSWYVKQALNRDLHTDIILFNPFSLSLEVRGADLPEHDGERFASLDQATVKHTIAGRPKHFYSIYRKMKEQEIGLDRVYDLLALRVIVADKADSYHALGILHSIFPPLADRIRDALGYSDVGR